MMTRKDFEYLARLVRSWRETRLLTYSEADAIAEDLAVFCSGMNPRFDKGRFMQACMDGENE